VGGLWVLVWNGEGRSEGALGGYGDAEEGWWWKEEHRAEQRTGEGGMERSLRRINGVVKPHAHPTSRNPSSQRQTLTCSGMGDAPVSVSVAMLDSPAAAVASLAIDRDAAVDEGVERDEGVRTESAMAVLVCLCSRGRR